MPKTGPRLGCRMHTAARWPIRLRPWTRPMLVVVLPSPSGVGVMAVTTTYLPRLPFAAASASRRVMPARLTLALYGPYCSTSSSRRPSSRASSSIGRGVTERAIARLLGIGEPLIGSSVVPPGRRTQPGRSLGLVRGGSKQVAQQQGVGERPNSAWNGRDRRDNILRRVEVHVTHEFFAALAVRYHVDAHVHHHYAWREHLAADQTRPARGHDQDLRVAGMVRQIAGARVEHS